MKRFVCVPALLATNGIPEKAKKLSEDSQLPINISDKFSEICIHSFPEIFEIESADKIESGLTYWLDITDEFNNFTESTFMIVVVNSVEKIISPLVREKHVLRFRSRLYEIGEYKYKIVDKDVVFYEGTFEVI